MVCCIAVPTAAAAVVVVVVVVVVSASWKAHLNLVVAHIVEPSLYKEVYCYY